MHENEKKSELYKDTLSGERKTKANILHTYHSKYDTESEIMNKNHYCVGNIDGTCNNCAGLPSFTDVQPVLVWKY